MHITSWRYMNDVTQKSINKERSWLTLTLLRLEGRSRSHDILMFLHREMQADNYTENVNIELLT